MSVAISLMKGISQAFATRADFVAWVETLPIAGQPNSGYPAVGAVVEVDGKSYRYTGTGTAEADLPGWVQNSGAFYKGEVEHTAFDPAFSRVLVSGGDGNYRHEATACQTADGVLHTFWQGNDTSASESATGQRIWYRKSTNGGATWTAEAKVVDMPSTNTLTPTAIQSAPRCVTVGNELWLFFGNRGTGGQEALIWGRLTAAGVWTWRRCLSDASQVLSWSSTSLTGAAPVGYTLTYTVQGDVTSLVPTSVLARDDGGVDLLLIGSVSFGLTHHMFLTRLDSAGAFTLQGSPIPSGADLTPAPWEGSLVALPDGGYVVHARRLLVYAGVSGIVLTAGTRQIRAESTDGIGWTAWEVTGMRVHSSKGSIAKLTPNRWVFAGTADWTERNDLCIGISRDPRVFNFGPLAANEDITTDFSEYPEVIAYTYGGALRIGVIYSGRTQVSVAPNEIRWASCLAPTGDTILAQATAQRGNREDATAVSTASGQIITIPPKASMSWEPSSYEVEQRSIRWKVDTVPGGIPYILASVGNYLSWSQIYLTVQGGEYVLKLDGQTIGTAITDPTVWQTLVFEIDKQAGVLRFGGRSVALSSGGIAVTSGDAFDFTGSTGGTAGNLLIDASQSSVAPIDRFAGASVASSDGGENYFCNPEFSIDQRFIGASIGNGVGDKLDATYLVDNGGNGLSISQGSFSLSAAISHTGGVQTHLAIERTSAGTSAIQFDLYLGDLMVMAGRHAMIEFDAYDANGLEYAMEVWAIHNYGSGGSTAQSFRLGTVLIDGLNGRRHSVERFWPTISSSATVGTDAFCALQLRPAFHDLVDDASLRVGRVDVHSGRVRRPFQRQDPEIILSKCQRLFRSIRALAASAVFGTPLAVSTTAARMPLWRDNMRKEPTLTSSGSFQLTGATSQSVTGLTIARPTELQSDLNITVASGLTAWTSYQLRDAGAGDAAMFLSARYR